jgi:ABC-type transporter lipoprotein component MlaA
MSLEPELTRTLGNGGVHQSQLFAGPVLGRSQMRDAKHFQPYSSDG